jgi:hypothetical protein
MYHTTEATYTTDIGAVIKKEFNYNQSDALKRI